MNGRLSKIRSLHMYVMHWMFFLNGIVHHFTLQNSLKVSLYNEISFKVFEDQDHI